MSPSSSRGLLPRSRVRASVDNCVRLDLIRSLYFSHSNNFMNKRILVGIAAVAVVAMTAGAVFARGRNQSGAVN